MKDYRCSAFSIARTLLACLALPLSLWASESRVSADRTINVNSGQLGSAGRVLHIETANGDIHFTSTDLDEILVEAQIVVSGRQAETCQALADQVRIKVEVVGESIELVTTKPKKFGYNFSVSYDVRGPRRLGVSAETVNGEVLVLGAEGPITIESVNGTVRSVETKGRIEASTTNGNITLTQVSASSIEASTVNGRIDCSCRDRSPDRMDISTVNGSVEITLPPQVNAQLSADTVNGGVHIDLGSGKVVSKSRGSVEMNVGTGASMYEFSSVNGEISVAVSHAD